MTAPHAPCIRALCKSPEDTQFLGYVGGELIRQGIRSNAQDYFVDTSRRGAPGTQHYCPSCNYTFTVDTAT